MGSRYHIFPWREEDTVKGTPVLRPTIDVPRGIADALAIDLPDPWGTGLKKIQLLGRDWPAFSVTIQLQLDVFEDMAWVAEVDFVLDEGLRFGLLGYEGFLNPFEEFQRRWPDSYRP